MWNTFGESAFEFEVLDILENDDNPRSETNEELRTLMEMWIQKLEDTGVITVRI